LFDSNDMSLRGVKVATLICGAWTLGVSGRGWPGVPCKFGLPIRTLGTHI